MTNVITELRYDKQQTTYEEYTYLSLSPKKSPIIA